MKRGMELRRRLWPKLDSALDRLGGYAVSTVKQEEYVGTADADPRRVEQVLRDAGFGFEVISALKHRASPRPPRR